jgi:hypothetical protein
MEFDREAADEVIRVLTFTADNVALKEVTSTIRNPDGSRQRETQAEKTGRIVREVILHGLEQGLLAFPSGIRNRLDQGFVLDRESP